MVPLLILFFWVCLVLLARLAGYLLELDLSVPAGESSDDTPGEQHLVDDWLSFFAGEGDPNKTIEDWKWRLIANLIWKNQGALTSEQLAPYTGAAPGDESGVLPVLAHFNGRPMATEKGNIVYVFPDLRSSVADADILPEMPLYLKEKYWRFCCVHPDSMLFIDSIGILNMFWLVLVPWGCLAAASFTIDPVSFYQLLLFMLPVLRKCLVLGRNCAIARRNVKRAAYAQNLESPGGYLAEKLEECKELRIPEEHAAQQEVAYTTERNLLEQEIEQLEAQAAGGTKRESAGPVPPTELAAGTIDLPPPDADPDSLTIDIRQKEPDAS